MASFENAFSDNLLKRDLFRAIYSGTEEKINNILDSFAPSYLLPWEESQQLLTAAIECGRLSIAKLLLKKGCEVKDTLAPGSTLYPGALLAGDAELVGLLLDKDPKSVDSTLHGKTLLHLAVCEDKMPVVELLLERGANINFADIHGLSPLHEATRSGNVEIVRLLLDAGADTECRSPVGETSLLYAVRHESVSRRNKTRCQVVKELVSSGADLNYRNDFGQTALHMACLLNRTYIVCYLVKAGADINATDSRGSVPFDAFCNRGLLLYEDIDSIFPINLTEHMLKLKGAGFYLHENNQEFLDELMEFYWDNLTVSHGFEIAKSAMENCQKEIDRMKSVRAYSGATLYDILKQFNNPFYFATKSEMILLQSVSTKPKHQKIPEHKFCLYRNIFHNILERFYYRKYLLDQAQDRLKFLINLCEIKPLPEELILYVISYLKNDELYLFINAVVKIKNPEE